MGNLSIKLLYRINHRDVSLKAHFTKVKTPVPEPPSTIQLMMMLEHEIVKNVFYCLSLLFDGKSVITGNFYFWFPT